MATCRYIRIKEQCAMRHWIPSNKLLLAFSTNITKTKIRFLHKKAGSDSSHTIPVPEKLFRGGPCGGDSTFTHLLHLVLYLQNNFFSSLFAFSDLLLPLLLWIRLLQLSFLIASPLSLPTSNLLS
ncbi:hypothetical protein VNO78_08342 [Psophocarpus tetragonolobus]|uniref:Uncharacterized protein n=1 Tax=Psophocarpus tetragonolobus TaxID=3891 RepID=A0AAN9SW96_PSOTE